jgi:hypothetical protein
MLLEIKAKLLDNILLNAFGFNKLQKYPIPAEKKVRKKRVYGKKALSRLTD